MQYGIAKLKIVCVWILLPAVALMAASFYVDPQTGSMDNAGSSLSPWKTLREVIESGKIETREPAVTPYEWDQPLRIKNAGGPVKAGDTLMLRNGYHGHIAIRAAYNSAPIVIMAQSGHHPSVSRLRFQAAGKWTVSGLTVSPEFEPGVSGGPLVMLERRTNAGPVRDIVIDNCDIYSVKNFSSWSESAWESRAFNGIEVYGNRNVISNNRVNCVLFGICVYADSNLVERNSVTNYGSDSYRGVANDLTFQYNSARNCYGINGNHDDGFQSWSLGAGGSVGTGTMRRVKIIGNTIITYGKDAVFPFIGDMQGIGLFDGMFEDWVIENNVVLVDHFHGITIMGGINCRIVNNTVCYIRKGAKGPPWIRIARHKNGTPSRGCIVRNNLSTGFSIQDPSSVTMDHNVTISDPNLFFSNFGNYDVRLKPGSPAIGAGTHLGAPATDILANPRPPNVPMDAGAYRYMSTAVLSDPAAPRQESTEQANAARAEDLSSPSVTWVNASNGRLAAKFALPAAMNERVRRATVEIYSLNGALLNRGIFVKSGDAEDNLYEMNTRNLLPGIYLMRVKFGNDRIIAQKITVR